MTDTQQERRQRTRGKEITPLQAALVLGIAFFVLYALTRTRDLGGDDTVFALAIEAWLRHRSLWWDFFHPHHVLYNPLVALLTAAVRTASPGILVVDAGAFLSALLGGATVGAVTLLLMRRGFDTGTSLLSAASMGLLGGFWQFSTRLEVYTLAALAVTVWLALLSRRQPPASKAGASLGACLLTHLALGVLVPATLLRTAPPWRRRLIALCVGLAVPGVVLGVLFLVRFGLHPAAWIEGIIPQSYDVYVGPRNGTVLGALHGLLWWGWYHGVAVWGTASAGLFDLSGRGGLILAIALVALALSRLLGGEDDGRTRLARTAGLALAGFLPLWLVWDTGNVEHTVASAPLWAVFLALGAERLPRRLGKVALGSLVLLLGIGNGLGSAVPQSRPENGRVWTIASFVRETTPETATLLSVGSDARLRLGLQYLGGRRVVDLTLAASSAKQQGRDPRIALEYWTERARAAGTVWLLPDVLDPSSADWVASLGIPREDWLRTVSVLRPGPAAVLPADGVVLSSPFVLRRATAR